MMELHTIRTYDYAFARARQERAQAFRALLTFRMPEFLRGTLGARRA